MRFEALCSDSAGWLPVLAIREVAKKTHLYHGLGAIQTARIWVKGEGKQAAFCQSCNGGVCIYTFCCLGPRGLAISEVNPLE